LFTFSNKKHHKYCRDCIAAGRHYKTSKALINGQVFTVDELADATNQDRETLRGKIQEFRRTGDVVRLIERQARGGNRSPGKAGRRILFSGENDSIAGWSRRVGISPTTLSNRARLLGSFEEALRFYLDSKDAT